MRWKTHGKPPRQFRSVALYLDDIREILAIVNLETGAKACLGDGEYHYDSLENLVEQYGERTDHLTITSAKDASPSIALVVDDGVSLETDFSSVAGKRVYYRIAGILNKRRRSFHWLCDMPFARPLSIIAPLALAACILLTLLLPVVLPRFVATPFWPIVGLVEVVLLLYVMGDLYSASILRGRFSTVLLVKSQEAPQGFLQRHWGKIVFALLAVVLAASVKWGYDVAMEWRQSQSAQQVGDTAETSAGKTTGATATSTAAPNAAPVVAEDGDTTTEETSPQTNGGTPGRDEN